jgi:hypothetical protein
LSQSLNIISFDVPFPANYGGVIDVYYKLYWLKQAGVKIQLHCFTYGRRPAKELTELCETVNYYERKTGLASNLSLLPYTVKSRQSKELEANLLKNDFPILFEVLHTCYLLNDPRFKNRKKIYRHSNIEHDYYTELAKSERNWVKRIFLKIEAFRLKKFEPILTHANLILAVNQKDTAYFKDTYPNVKSVYLPSFHANAEVQSATGKGNSVLFHGNLSVSENYEAVVWLITNVFSSLNTNIIIAGLKPPLFLKQLCDNYKHIQLIANPSQEEIDTLIRDAGVHVLYTAQPTGLKLKLLNVLFSGRFIVLNQNMLEGTGLLGNDSLVIAHTANDFIQSVNLLLEKDFTPQHSIERKELVKNFDNKLNADKLISEVF